MSSELEVIPDEDSSRHALTLVYTASFNAPRFDIGAVVYELHAWGTVQGKIAGLSATIPIEAMTDQVLFIEKLEEAASVVSVDDLVGHLSLTPNATALTGTLRQYLFEGQLPVWVAHLYMSCSEQPDILWQRLAGQLQVLQGP